MNTVVKIRHASIGPILDSCRVNTDGQYLLNIDNQYWANIDASKGRKVFHT